MTAFERGRALAVAWSDGTTVSGIWARTPVGGTVVEIVNAGFAGSPTEIVETALESTQGFHAIVLCDLKVLLVRRAPPRTCPGTRQS